MRKVIVKTITVIAVFLLTIGVAAADSDSIVPMFVMAISLVWLWLVVIANQDLLEDIRG